MGGWAGVGYRNQLAKSPTSRAAGGLLFRGHSSLHSATLALLVLALPRCQGARGATLVASCQLRTRLDLDVGFAGTGQDCHRFDGADHSEGLTLLRDFWHRGGRNCSAILCTLASPPNKLQLATVRALDTFSISRDSLGFTHRRLELHPRLNYGRRRNRFDSNGRPLQGRRHPLAAQDKP